MSQNSKKKTIKQSLHIPVTEMKSFESNLKSKRSNIISTSSFDVADLSVHNGEQKKNASDFCFKTNLNFDQTINFSKISLLSFEKKTASSVSNFQVDQQQVKANEFCSNDVMRKNLFSKMRYVSLTSTDEDENEDGDSKPKFYLETFQEGIKKKNANKVEAFEMNSNSNSNSSSIKSKITVQNSDSVSCKKKKYSKELSSSLKNNEKDNRESTLFFQNIRTKQKNNAFKEIKDKERRFTVANITGSNKTANLLNLPRKNTSEEVRFGFILGFFLFNSFLQLFS